ncbi:hypothetical protein DES53_115169 [Roseimicrobium gellanilyticum]|uniref:Uncharacterized protein n=1 Tax=Roseimicrobium gellanilyticum TaxID=748857 RepID=A0A366H542_9BACT|nr:hypothetical protein DES53_115169 [Roseimicrobium gellanilyticum]
MDKTSSQSRALTATMIQDQLSPGGINWERHRADPRSGNASFPNCVAPPPIHPSSQNRMTSSKRRSIHDRSKRCDAQRPWAARSLLPLSLSAACCTPCRDEVAKPFWTHTIQRRCIAIIALTLGAGACGAPLWSGARGDGVSWRLGHRSDGLHANQSFERSTSVKTQNFNALRAQYLPPLSADSRRNQYRLTPCGTP